MLPSALDDEVAGRMNKGANVCHEAFTSICYQEIVPGALSRPQWRQSLQRHFEQSDTAHIQGKAADHRGPKAEAWEYQDNKEHIRGPGRHEEQQMFGIGQGIVRASVEVDQNE